MTDFYARRGGRSLTEDEFRSHVALAVRLENVGVLLGAGASKGAGGRLMLDVWRDFCHAYFESATWMRDQRFVPAEALAGDLAVNVEMLLDVLEIARIEWRRRDGEATAQQLRRHQANLMRAVLKAATLDAALWCDPAMVADEPAFEAHLRLLSRLVSNRQPGQAAPWVFTTNYDLAVEWSAEALGIQVINGFSGLHARSFSPSSFDLGYRNTRARGEARFGTYNVYLGKMHGSVSWNVASDGSVREVPAPAQWPAVQRFLAAENGEEWPGLLIFPGAAKYVQTLGFVYGEIIRRFTEFLSRPNTCLFVNGYAFSDDHLNRIIVSALQNPTLQLVIYLPELDRLGLFGLTPALGVAPLAPNPLLARLLRKDLPQVCVCGSGARAYFDAMSQDLPEPALLDDPAAQARSLMRLLGATAATGGAGEGEGA